MIQSGNFGYSTYSCYCNMSSMKTPPQEFGLDTVKPVGSRSGNSSHFKEVWSFNVRDYHLWHKWEIPGQDVKKNINTSDEDDKIKMKKRRV
jgi:hypothetical protein